MEANKIRPIQRRSEKERGEERSNPALHRTLHPRHAGCVRTRRAAGSGSVKAIVRPQKSMKSIPEIVIVMLTAVVMSGCVYALGGHNETYPVKMRIDKPFPSDFRVLVASREMKTYYFDEDGRVMFDIPSLGRGCRVYLLGCIKVADYGATAKRATYIFEDENVVRALSIDDIQRLPVEKDGFRYLKIK